MTKNKNRDIKTMDETIMERRHDEYGDRRDGSGEIYTHVVDLPPEDENIFRRALDLCLLTIGVRISSTNPTSLCLIEPYQISNGRTPNKPHLPLPLAPTKFTFKTVNNFNRDKRSGRTEAAVLHAIIMRPTGKQLLDIFGQAACITKEIILPAKDLTESDVYQFTKIHGIQKEFRA
ncbi:Hypothetical protein CINCED_3A012552 [Cinara cedri]|uniref:Uncharacterized protein n=1 Tax=Cinara cedri TaxID=506608 RepID=A0A5E4N7P2_9HEMI|nr:Hypothetical protein CINCED_3A012552 [Cinara cedri]